MTKRVLVTIVVAVVVFAFVLILALTKGPGGTIGLGGAPAKPSAPTTRDTLSRNIVITVPEPGATDVPEGIAVPEAVAPAPPHRAGASQRTFDIKIEKDQFSSEVIAVNFGDTVRINITAIDKAYDYSQPDYGFKVILAKGETKFTQFDATAAGRFTIFCESCGGPEKGPVGYLEVVPKQQ